MTKWIFDLALVGLYLENKDQAVSRIWLDRSMEGHIKVSSGGDGEEAPTLLILSSPVRALGNFPAVAKRDKALAAAFGHLGFAPVLRRVSREDEVLEALDFYSPALVFSTLGFLAGSGGRRRNVHETLGCAGYPYIGSPPETLDLAQSRSAVLAAWRRSGIATPDWLCLGKGLDEGGWLPEGLTREGGVPVILKPAREGRAGAEILATSPGELRTGVASLLASSGEVLVEGLPGGDSGREFSVAMLGEGGRALFLPVERRPSHSRHRVLLNGQDRAGKLPESRPLPPGRLRRELCDLAHSALSVLGCRDYGRLDVLLAEDRLWALGASAQPRLPDPLFSACAAGAGLTTEGCLGAMVLSALGRQPQRNAKPGSLPSSLILALPPGLVAFFGAELCEGEGAA